MSSVEFTTSKQGHIIQLKELGYTYDQIHTKLGVSKSGAWWTIQHDKIVMSPSISGQIEQYLYLLFK